MTTIDEWKTETFSVSPSSINNTASKKVTTYTFPEANALLITIAVSGFQKSISLFMF